jgi:hypothetical protein
MTVQPWTVTSNKPKTPVHLRETVVLSSAPRFSAVVFGPAPADHCLPDFSSPQPVRLFPPCCPRGEGGKLVFSRPPQITPRVLAGMSVTTSQLAPPGQCPGSTQAFYSPRDHAVEGCHQLRVPGKLNRVWQRSRSVRSGACRHVASALPRAWTSTHASPRAEALDCLEGPYRAL